MFAAIIQAETASSIGWEVAGGFIIQLLAYAFVQGRVFQRQRDIGKQLDDLSVQVSNLPCRNYCKILEAIKK